MKIERITISQIRLPFRVAYGHKQKTHKDVCAVLCQVQDSDGHTGLGESVPRAYVTGETAYSAFEDALTLGKKLLGAKLSSVEDIQSKMTELAKDWPAPFPSCAFCCVDLALHDCLAQRQKQDMATYLGAQTKPLPYTASIGLSSKTKLLALLALYRLSGIRSFKLKVGDDHDLDRLRLIKNIMGEDAPVFADANGAWSEKDAPGKIETLARHGIWAIEEPLPIPMPMPSQESSEGQINRDALMPEEHYARYVGLRQNISIPIILDESLISPQSFEKIIKHDAADILNIRLSKLGGYSLATHILKTKPESIKFSLGAMVGESPVLASAGYFFGCAHPDHLYIQGYSHRILHGKTFVQGGPTMKRGTVSMTTPQTGLGLTLKPGILEKLTIKEETLTHEKV